LSTTILIVHLNWGLDLIKKPFNRFYAWFQLTAYPFAWLLHQIGVKADYVSVARCMVSWPVITMVHHYYGFGNELIGTVTAIAYSDLVDGVMAQEFEKKPPGAWGAKVDSLADKILAMRLFSLMALVHPWLAMIMLGGEIINLMMAKGLMIYGYQIQPNIYGKWKFGLQVVTSILFILDESKQIDVPDWAIFIVGFGAVKFLVSSWLEELRQMNREK